MKTILITGASSGFGYVTALLLARKGYAVYASVRNIESKSAQDLQKIAVQENLSMTLVKLDVTSQKDIDKLAHIAGVVDVLINNAGIGFLGAAEEFTIDEVKEQFEVNFFGTIRMIQMVLPEMRKKKKGLIINISSLNGHVSFPLYGVYSSSKFALETYSEALRFELHPFHIYVSLVEPGAFITNFTKNRHFPAAQAHPESVYIPLTKRFFRIFNRFEQLKHNSIWYYFVNPERVAEKILRIIETPTPKLHNPVGIQAHGLIFLNNILPHSVKEFLLRQVYHWK